MKFGDCKCIPKDDKENLIKAIDVAKDYIKKSSSGSSGSKIKDTDLSVLQDRIKKTKVCKDGNILTKCTCFSNFERKMISDVVKETLRSHYEYGSPDFYSIHDYYRISEKVKKVINICPKKDLK